MDVAVVCNRLASIIDRLAHRSTTDFDLEQTVGGLRRICKDRLPSEILQMRGSQLPNNSNRQIADLKRRIATMRAEKIELEAEHAELQREHILVKQELESLRAKQRPERPNSIKEFYSYDEVTDIFREKFGKLNGTQTLWAAYSAELHTYNPQSPLLTISRLQSWRKDKKFPGWAVKQLLEMPIVEKVQYRWSEEDIEFLANLHIADPFKTDEQLARECSFRFGVSINTNSVKSKFTILRKQGRIPLVRPVKTTSG